MISPSGSLAITPRDAASLSDVLASLRDVERISAQQWEAECPTCEGGTLTVYILEDPYLGREAARWICDTSGCSPLPDINPDDLALDVFTEWADHGEVVEVGLARMTLAMMKQDGMDVRYDPSAGWFLWDGQRWTLDSTKNAGALRSVIHELGDRLQQEAALWAAASVKHNDDEGNSQRGEPRRGECKIGFNQ